MENIDADFDIFSVEKVKQDYYKCNILDSALYEFKAVAVQWMFGAKALVLFRKGEVTEKQFKESIMREYTDVKIQKIDLYDSDACAKSFYYENRALAQVLMNSLKAPEHEAFKYNNLTGKLFYHNPSWKNKDKQTDKVKYMKFLQIVIDPGMYLNLEQKTFKKYDREGAGLYVIDPKTGQFRKKLKTDGKIDTYKEGSMKQHNKRIENFNIDSYKNFKESKLGVMEQFLKDVEENLSSYMTIEILEREDAQKYEISSLEKKGITDQEYGEMLKKRGVVIVDENHTETSKLICERLKNELKERYGVDATRGELSEEAYNLRIIHNQEYYEENNIRDLHDENLEGYIIQHITEETESFNEKWSSAAVKKIVQELIIKGDVRDKQISIFDWERLDSGKEWTFVIRRKIKKEPGEKTEHINYAGQKSYDYYRYVRLKITRNGKMEFDEFSDKDQEATGEWMSICSEFDHMEKEHHGARNQIEGLIYSDLENIHTIILTTEKTIPNITALMNTLKQTEGKSEVSKEVLLGALDEFQRVNTEATEQVAEWKNELESEEEKLTKKKIKNILGMKKNLSSLFNRFFHENYGIWLDGELRKEEFNAIYQINNLLNIKYEYIENDYIDENAFIYYVGAKSKRVSYPNACCIRKVVSKGENIEYEEILPLMAVDFVRTGQYTVVPFPYKYLREYAEQV